MFDFTANVYTVPPTAMQAVSTRTIAVDYGTLNPTCFLSIFDDGETVRVDRNTAGMAARNAARKPMKNMPTISAFMGDNPCAAYVDPSAASFITALRQRGVYVMEANNDVLNGIRRCSTLISSADCW